MPEAIAANEFMNLQKVRDSVQIHQVSTFLENLESQEM